MKYFYLFLIFFLLINSSNSRAQPFPYEINTACSLPSLKLSLEMYVEDIKTNTYVFSWEYDSGSNEELNKNYYENKLDNCGLSFLITDSKQNLGRYNGLSTPMTFCYFIPTEDSITVYMELGGNFSYSDCKCMYQKIQLPVINHFKTEVILQPDTTVRYLQWMTEGLSDIMRSDPMPGGYEPYKFISYMYYLNRHNGKIRSGRFLLNNFSVAYLCSHIGYYKIIDPLEFYKNRQGQTFKGYDLIRMKKISAEAFDFDLAFELNYNFWAY